MTSTRSHLPRSVHTLVGLLTLAVVVCAAQPQSPSLHAANVLRDALKEQGSAPKMEIIARTSQELRQVVSEHLDARLLTETQAITGRDFQYRFADPTRTAHLGVIVLQYPDVGTARQQAKVLSARKNYFQNSKILIRFSVVPLERLLVVAYSENSGDARIVEALDHLPASFERSGAGAVSWGEPVR